MSMIDRLHGIARAVRMLRLPSIVVGWLSLASLVVTIFILAPHQGDRFIIPGLVGLLWAVSTYAFIVTFATVPAKPGRAPGIFSRLKQKIQRGWYWLISVIFLITTVIVIGLTVRMVSIWLREYGG
ncbi:hypothetical protein DSCA_13580 [Desulfosarcina alkanivorans]|uniref:Uncharacterized protein n=2 Tax=Desulfosarcina alkanivorans TaxID=571177 RepID=A0A5K7YED1_9BACT|nr:hypothetical protein DSCA_13580 [Desulfosarcina alkanivorans]